VLFQVFLNHRIALDLVLATTAVLTALAALPDGTKKPASKIDQDEQDDAVN
jgi:hypothetical protein